MRDFIDMLSYNYGRDIREDVLSGEIGSAIVYSNAEAQSSIEQKTLIHLVATKLDDILGALLELSGVLHPHEVFNALCCSHCASNLLNKPHPTHSPRCGYSRWTAIDTTSETATLHAVQKSWLDKHLDDITAPIAKRGDTNYTWGSRAAISSVYRMAITSSSGSSNTSLAYTNFTSVSGTSSNRNAFQREKAPANRMHTPSIHFLTRGSILWITAVAITVQDYFGEQAFRAKCIVDSLYMHPLYNAAGANGGQEMVAFAALIEYGPAYESTPHR